MGKGCGSWVPQQFDWRSPNLNFLGAPRFRQQATNSEFAHPGFNMVSATGAMAFGQNPGLPHFGLGQGNESCGWYYCLPRFRQAFTPVSNSTLKEAFAKPQEVQHKETIIPKTVPGCTQKRFLVFDQSGDQTTLIFSSAFGAPVNSPTWNPIPLAGGNLNGQEPMLKKFVNVHQESVPVDEFDENEMGVQSEMHEDTEELNALLYSDSESDYSEDEVTSTGHSPSTMTAHDERFEGDSEEVASNSQLPKKRKLVDDYDDHDPLVTDTACSAKSSSRFSGHEDDAESSSANGHSPGSNELFSASENKRMRREKIRETVGILRSIIPSGEGKDPILVLDEAIDYLKSLKSKAKALGIGTL